MSENIRVRFAPSPTGALHIGGVRTALYNYLFAKKNGGKLILRIEDTDQTRFVPGAEQYILQALDWCGIMPDEGTVQGGEYGPYRQSERKEIYGEYAQKLVSEGKAYYAFDTPEELDAMRERLKEARVANPQYNSITRMQMKNSLTLSAEEVEKKKAEGEPYVIRIKVPRDQDIRFQDLVRGWVHVNSSTLDDKVLMKSDGMPTYHLANIVDDHLMKISHVIRGEEWLPSAPLHVLLYQYLGWENSMPAFAHLPLLLKPDGNGKLSKRDADKHGFPIFPLDWTDPQSGELSKGFKEEGYLSEAFINFLSLLGWNPGTEQELFSFDALVQSFSLERINKAGAKFDIEKAKWFNQQYIRNKPDEELAAYLENSLEEEGKEIDKTVVGRVAAMMRERITFPDDIFRDAWFIFERPGVYDEKTVRKKWTDQAVQVLADYKVVLDGHQSLTADEARALLVAVLAKDNVPLGRVMPAVRVALTGMGGGPDLMEIISILGPKEVSDRISIAIDALKEQVKV